MDSPPNWLNRYRHGQRSRVWHELRQVGGTVRETAVLEEAQLVCDEMARRARHNIEVIVERLSIAGYRFHSNDDAQTPVTPYIPPTAAASEHAAWLEERFGPVPMTVLSWVRLVGDVWLVGTHPQWAASASADPLVIELEGSRYPGYCMRDHFEESLEGWQEWRAHDPTAGPFVLPLSPGLLHKRNVSGGPPYGITVPDGCVDGLFVAQTTMPFVSYLNWVFRNGGFPWPTASNAQWRYAKPSPMTSCRSDTRPCAKPLGPGAARPVDGDDPVRLAVIDVYAIAGDPGRLGHERASPLDADYQAFLFEGVDRLAHRAAGQSVRLHQRCLRRHDATGRELARLDLAAECVGELAP